MVENDDYLSDLNKHIEILIQDKPIDVLRVRRARQQHSAMLHTGERQSLNELMPQDVFAKRLAVENLDEETQARLSQHFEQVLSAVLHADTQDLHSISSSQGKTDAVISSYSALGTEAKLS